MAFFLVKDREFQLNKNGQFSRYCCVRSIAVPVSIAPTQKDGTISDRECARLKTSLQIFHDENARSQKPDEKSKELFDSTLNVTLAIYWKQEDSNEDQRNFVTVTDADNGGVLKALKSFLKEHELKLKISVRLHSITTSFNNSDGEKIQTMGDVISLETDLDEISSSNGAQLLFSDDLMQTFWHPTNDCVHNGAITISCLMFPAKYILNLRQPQNNDLLDQVKELNKALLRDGIEHDAYVYADDSNSQLSCHKAFLTVHSTVLQDILKKDPNTGSPTGMVIMSELTEDSVEPFMVYLYTRNDDEADKRCDIAVDFLHVGIKYSIIQLKYAMKFLLLSKPNAWFNMAAIVKLFVVARDLHDGDELKMRANAMILQLNFATIQTLHTYQELEQADKNAVNDLFGNKADPVQN